MKGFIIIFCAFLGSGLAGTIPSNSKDRLQDFYTLCESDSSIKCATPTYEGECFKNKNCTLAVAMETTDQGFVFSMYANSDVQYMSLGFSKDLDMGDDPVVQCVRDDSGNVTGQLSYNVGLKNERLSDDGLTLIDGVYEDGVLYCKVSLDDTLKFAQHVDTYTAVSYYLIAAAGPLKANGDLAVHNGLILNEQKWKLGQDLLQDFYPLCESDSSIKCAVPSYEANCYDSKNCTLVVAMETTDKGFVFSMYANSNVQYMSLGFSKDQDMGDDPVVQCVRDENDTIVGQLSYNVGLKNERLPDDGLTLVESAYEDGVLYCKVTLADTLKFAQHVDTYTAVSYYLIAAAGPLKANGDLAVHNGLILNVEKWKLGENLHDDFYDLCDKENVKCAGAWSKSSSEGGSSACLQWRNCTKVFAMETVEDEDNVFTMLALNDVSYMSIGFSADDQMGDEPVIACIRNDTQVTGSLSYNVGYKNINYDSNNGLKMIETKAEDDYIYCKFQLAGTLNFANRMVGNGTEANLFYMLGASGSLKDDGSLGHHSGRIVSDDMWLVSSSATVFSSFILSLVGYLITRHM